MRIDVRSGLWAALVGVAAMATTHAMAQASAPDAPTAPSARGTAAAPLQPMPAPDPANFTAATPTKETVNEFLRQSWGYDPDRLWQVQAIQTTPVQGLSRVTVLAEEKGSEQQQPSALIFLTLPDGKHLIANDEVMPFGARPFDSYRSILRQEAKGPSRGPANAPLLLVEFADFQCPHCKDAQPTVERLLKDYPQARFVAQPFPLRQIHNEAEKAAETGVCVNKVAGNDAYFKYADAVYADQGSLTPEKATQALQAGVMASGADATKVQACMGDPSTKATIDASLQLGAEVGVNSTPTLLVNGRALPFAGIPYESLQKIIGYQLQIDGGK